MRDTYLYQLIDNSTSNSIKENELYRLINLYILRPKPEVISRFCDKLETLCPIWTTGKGILDLLQSLGSHLAYGVMMMSYPSYDSRWDKHNLIARSNTFFQRLKYELIKRERYPHTILTQTFTDRVFSWSRALDAIREISCQEESSRVYRGILVERLVIATSFASKFFALLLESFTRDKKPLELVSLKKVLSSTITEAMENPWLPTLNQEDLNKGIDKIPNEELRNCHALEINQLISKIVSREIIGFKPEMPSQFIFGLTKNESFQLGAKRLIEITPS